MLPSIADILLEKKNSADPSSAIEVDYLHTRWREIRSQLLYADLFEGTLLNRLKMWHQLQKACLFEQKHYQSHHQYKVPNHILKKDLMELFKVPSKNIVVDNDSFHKTSLKSCREKLDQKDRTSLRQQMNVDLEDILIYLADEPNLQNGLYQALSTMKYFMEETVAHLKLILNPSNTTSTIHKQIKELGISSMIIVADTKLSQTDLLEGCDIAFLPALYAPHTPSLIKAMAFECPVVLSSEVAGLETYLQLLNPYAFTKGSQPPQIANCLLPLIRSQTLRQQVGKQNAQAIENLANESYLPHISQNADGPGAPSKVLK